MPASSNLTVPQVAQLLKTTIPYAQRLLREGKIRSWKDDQGWRTTRGAVDEYLAAREVSASGTRMRRLQSIAPRIGSGIGGLWLKFKRLFSKSPAKAQPATARRASRPATNQGSRPAGNKPRKKAGNRR